MRQRVKLSEFRRFNFAYRTGRILNILVFWEVSKMKTKQTRRKNGDTVERKKYDKLEESAKYTQAAG